MKRFLLPTLMMLAIPCAAYAIKITLFMDTATFAQRAVDIIIADCDQPMPETNYRHGLHPVDVTVVNVLKGNLSVNPMKIATIYPMVTGRKYLLASLGGSVDGITFLAIPELSVVEIPVNFDMSAINGKPLVEQLTLVFVARKAEVDRQLKQLKSEADLLEKAI